MIQSEDQQEDLYLFWVGKRVVAKNVFQGFVEEMDVSTSLSKHGSFSQRSDLSQ